MVKIGITVTANLGLIKPDDSESIRANLPTFAGWAAQNGLNCDNIDRLFRATNHTYTPTWIASSVNPTLGAGGLIEGKYLRVFPRMVFGYFRIFCGGAGFATGTGAYNISLPPLATPPVEFASLANSGELPLGKCVFLDASAVATSSVFSVIYSKTASNLFMRDSNALTWSTTAGIVPAQNDRYSGYFMYPTSDA